MHQGKRTFQSELSVRKSFLITCVGQIDRLLFCVMRHTFYFYRLRQVHQNRIQRLRQIRCTHSIGCPSFLDFEDLEFQFLTGTDKPFQCNILKTVLL